MDNKDKADKLKEYLSEKFPWIQELKLASRCMWRGCIILVPIILFVICFWRCLA